jgi:hypothetical protein
MANFDYKKYLAEGKLYEADNKSVLRTLIQDLEPFEYEVYADDAGVNPEDGAEMEEYIASLSDEEVSSEISKLKGINEDKLDEAMFDVVTTEKVAQKIADTFTADDELDLKYVVNPRIDSGSFDLDVEAGPNTPGEDWKDVNGFGIDNYLGDFAGGSFYIKDGVVYNAAMRNAPVANVSAEGEVEMISAEDSRAAIGMEENKEETKSNKMKKSELKEMIKMAMMAEIDGSAVEAEDYDPVMEADEEVEDTETVDVAVGDTETIDTETTAEIDPNVKTAQDALTQAMEAARQLGDKKLQDQIGNTITFFTRQHVAGTETGAMAEADEMEEGKKEYYKDAEADDAEHIKALEKDMKDDKESSLKLGEVMFPMWTKIQK